jgi:hypothetical protein
LVMQWLKLVKTLVLPATKVPTRMENAMLTATARMPHRSPAAACPGFAVPPARPRVSECGDADGGRDDASDQAQRKQHERQGGDQAGDAQHKGGRAQAVLRPDGWR